MTEISNFNALSFIRFCGRELRKLQMFYHLCICLSPTAKSNWIETYKNEFCRICSNCYFDCNYTSLTFIEIHKFNFGCQAFRLPFFCAVLVDSISLDYQCSTYLNSTRESSQCLLLNEVEPIEWAYEMSAKRVEEATIFVAKSRTPCMAFRKRGEKEWMNEKECHKFLPLFSIRWNLCHRKDKRRRRKKQNAFLVGNS